MNPEYLLWKAFGENWKVAAMRRIWNSYYRKLVFYVSHSFGTGNEAEDMVQEIMEKIHLRLDSYDPAYALGTFVYSVARHHCIDRWRRRGKERTGLEDQIPDDRYRPDRIFERRESESRMKEFLEALPGPDREILFLRFSERKSYAEISRICGIPLHKVKNRIHQVRLRYQGDEEGAV